jgi:hypothetical protein
MRIGLGFQSKKPTASGNLPDASKTKDKTQTRLSLRSKDAAQTTTPASAARRSTS